MGSPTIVPLLDSETKFFQPRTEVFPTATPSQWAAADAFDPAAAGPDDQWLLHIRAFAIRPPNDDGSVIIVDSGVGLTSGWAPAPGQLPQSLQDEGIDPADVRQVVITHLHTDHIGWARDGLFPNADIYLQRAELSWTEPALPRDQLVLLDGDSRLAEGVRIVATPGHTPGHQSVLAGDTLITGDLLVHAVQLLHPELEYAHEMDPARARESRMKWLPQARVLATPHLTEPFRQLS
jgi:glyoxylase-like metal-dependent hydrolase (beta-lactamase superfamily II)